MAVNTRVYDRRKRLRQQHQDRDQRELRRQLFVASKSVKSFQPLGGDVEKLPLQRQIDLLSEYADQLLINAREFVDRWPDDDGRRAARRLLTERGYVLDLIGKLTVGVIRGDTPVVKLP